MVSGRHIDTFSVRGSIDWITVFVGWCLQWYLWLLIIQLHFKIKCNLTIAILLLLLVHPHILSFMQHQDTSTYKTINLTWSSLCGFQCTDCRNQKERSLQARSSSKEKAQEEDYTPGWRYLGGSGSVLLPAGTGEGAAERQGGRDTATRWNRCLSYVRHCDSRAEVEARPGYSNGAQYVTTSVFQSKPLISAWMWTISCW